MIVKDKLFLLSLKFLLSMAWWLQVIVRPEETRIIVFNKGISKGLKGVIPRGGHNIPISMFGAKEE
jgi:hypothetical protein